MRRCVDFSFGIEQSLTLGGLKQLADQRATLMTSGSI
jgi:hypothetical protein